MGFLNIGRKDEHGKQRRIEHRGKYLRASRTGGIALRAQARPLGATLTANTQRGFRVSTTPMKNTQIALQVTNQGGQEPRTAKTPRAPRKTPRKSFSFAACPVKREACLIGGGDGKGKGFALWPALQGKAFFLGDTLCGLCGLAAKRTGHRRDWRLIFANLRSKQPRERLQRKNVHRISRMNMMFQKKRKRSPPHPVHPVN